jgi:hypothetical protein
MNNKTRTKQVATRTKRKTTEQEFNSVIPLLSISKNRIDAARKVMVEGRTLQNVADEYGLSRQSIDGSVAVVWSAIQKYREDRAIKHSDNVIMPPGWEQVTLVAPKRLIDKFKQEIASAFLNQDNKTT